MLLKQFKIQCYRHDLFLENMENTNAQVPARSSGRSSRRSGNNLCSENNSTTTASNDESNNATNRYRNKSKDPSGAQTIDLKKSDEAETPCGEQKIIGNDSIFHSVLRFFILITNISPKHPHEIIICEHPSKNIYRIKNSSPNEGKLIGAVLGIVFLVN